MVFPRAVRVCSPNRSSDTYNMQQPSKNLEGKLLPSSSDSSRTLDTGPSIPRFQVKTLLCTHREHDRPRFPPASDYVIISMSRHCVHVILVIRSEPYKYRPAGLLSNPHQTILPIPPPQSQWYPYELMMSPDPKFAIVTRPRQRLYFTR